jgi:hypothetical protein
MNPIKKQPDKAGHKLHFHASTVTLPGRSDSELQLDRSERLENDRNQLRLNNQVIS